MFVISQCFCQHTCVFRLQKLDCIETNKHKMRPKRNRAESLGCHDRHPLPRVCHNWQWRDVKRYVTKMIDIYISSPSVCLWKSAQHRQDYLSWAVIKFRTQYNTTTGPQADDLWRIPWHQREYGVVAIGFSRRPYATPEWRWIWHTSKIYGITSLCLTDCIEICPNFRSKLSDSVTQSAFWFRPVSIKRTNSQKSSSWMSAHHSPTVL